MEFIYWLAVSKCWCLELLNANKVKKYEVFCLLLNARKLICSMHILLCKALSIAEIILWRFFINHLKYSLYKLVYIVFRYNTDWI